MDCVTPALRPVRKIHGGKGRLARRIVALFPPGCGTFVGLTVGAGSVELNRVPGPRELISDIDPAAVRVFRALQRAPEAVYAALVRVQYSQDGLEALKASEPLSEAGKAARTVALGRMTRGGLGVDLSDARRTRGGQPGDRNSWETFLRDDLFRIVERVKNWELSCRCMLDALAEHDGPDVTCYLDPPYPRETRSTPEVYGPFEMPTYFRDEVPGGNASHERLLRLLVGLRAKVFISTYPNPLYREVLGGAGWRRHAFEGPNNAGQGAVKQRRIEEVWENRT